MKPILFKEADILFGKDQPKYKPLPAYRCDDGEVISCWGVGWFERLQVLFTGRVWVSVLSGGGPIQPIALHAVNPLIIAEEVAP